MLIAEAPKLTDIKESFIINVDDGSGLAEQQKVQATDFRGRV